MTKKDLIKAVATDVGTSQTKTADFVNSIFKVMKDTLSNGENINIADFMRIYVREKAGRTMVNPKTGDEVQIPTRNVIKFVACKALKDSIN